MSDSAMSEPVSSAGRVEIDPQFKVLVTYRVPSFGELKQLFSAYLNPAYEGAVFEPNPRCAEVARETREVTFCYLHFDRFVLHSTIMDEMDARSLRPATFEELLSFIEAHPEELGKRSFVAFGSEPLQGAMQDNAPFAWMAGGLRGLGFISRHDELLSVYRYLAVLK